MGPILVTGGTGTLGRVLVKRLLASGHDVRVLSRRVRPAADDLPHAWITGDLRSARGTARAVAGTEVIVHCATGVRGDVQLARHLIEQSQRAGAPHMIYISIVGVDRVRIGYYRAKLETERLVAGSGLPWTVLRATQFHDLILRGCRALSRLPVAPVPAGVSFQPIDVSEVAARLAELATAGPCGRVGDMGGPQVRSARDLMLSYLRATGRHRVVLPVRLPGAAARALMAGGNLAPGHADGRVTFEEFLACPGRG